MSNGLTATQQLAALRQRRTTSVALVDEAIARIEADTSLNAVVVRDFERARRDARTADALRAAGEDAPLLGLPVTVKECFDMTGLPTTWGLPGADAPAAADAVVVQRLRSAGAVLLGKTNIATMLADWQSSNPVYGTTNNPWDLQRTPGGSSGGGAAAVAAGLSALDIGSDIAGSLRLPAAFCGVCSHRPSHGLVPLRGAAPPMAPRAALAPVVDLAVAGPMARSAEDLSLALDVIAGADDADAVAWRLALPPARHRVWREHRVLVLDTHPLCPTAHDITHAVDRVARALQAEGCRVGREPRAVPDLADLSRTFQGLLMSFVGADLPEHEYREAARHAITGDEATRGLAMSHRDWIWLDRHRTQLAVAWQRTFADWDVVLCPAAPVTAFAHDDRPMQQRLIDVDGQSLPYGSLSCWAGISQPAGLPVTTVPVGLDRDGLPIGLQVIGPRLEDRTPLAFAAGLQALVEMPGRPPLPLRAATAPA